MNGIIIRNLFMSFSVIVNPTGRNKLLGIEIIFCNNDTVPNRIHLQKVIRFVFSAEASEAN